MLQDRDLLSVQEARDMVRKARVAFEAAKLLSQEQIDKIVKAMSDVAYAHSEELAKMAAEETSMGKYEDKIIKNHLASKAVYEAIKDMKTVGIVNEYPEKKMFEVAVPVGVVCGIVPCTNPTSTTIYKSMISMKSGNPVVFSPHPSAKNCIAKTCELMCEAAEKAGAPANMFQCLHTLSMAGSHELMTNSGVNMILATGGPEMVKAAYSSGVPALGVGAGNVPAFIDHTADVKLAVKRIFASKTFDNGVICASEQSIVAENCIKDQVIEAVKNEKGYILNDEEYAKLCKIFTRRPGSVNPAIVGRPATKIAAMAGIDVPADTRVLCYPEKGVGDEYPFSIEKLSPCLALYFEEDWRACCDRCIQLLQFVGIGHSLSMHTNDENVIREFALKKPVSRILVNTSSSQGGVGATTNLMPALTLGCGAVGGSATSDNVSPLNLINLRRVAYGVREAWDLAEKPAEENNLDADAIAKMVIDALKKL